MTISIIIPVYNTEAYLPACLDSILSQSFTDFEVLLVDDGSKDDSGLVCNEYAAKDSRIRVLHKENGGVSSARNMALERAMGTWICFVDSDDRLYSGGLQVLAEGISDEVDLIMAGFLETFLPVDNVEQKRSRQRIIERKEALLSMFNSIERKFEGYVFAKLFRRDIIMKEHISFNPTISIKEDTLFDVSFLCLSGKKVFISDTPVYCHLQRPSSAMESLNESYNPNYLTSFEAIVLINRLVESAFPGDIQLLSLSREELMDRVYRIKGHMIKHNSMDKRLLSQLRRRALREIGFTHYLNYQFRRNKRRANTFYNRLFKTNIYV